MCALPRQSHSLSHPLRSQGLDVTGPTAMQGTPCKSVVMGVPQPVIWEPVWAGVSGASDSPAGTRCWEDCSPGSAKQRPLARTVRREWSLLLNSSVPKQEPFSSRVASPPSRDLLSSLQPCPGDSAVPHLYLSLPCTLCLQGSAVTSPVAVQGVLWSSNVTDPLVLLMCQECESRPEAETVQQQGGFPVPGSTSTTASLAPWSIGLLGCTLLSALP